MSIQFTIRRQTPERSAYWQTFELDIDPSLTILDALIQIKGYHDGSLSFRKNCRNTICGSCAMTINGRSALACQQSIRAELANSSVPNQIAIAPLGNLAVLKDLVVDMSDFWQKLSAINPYVSTAARQVPEREFLQSPSDRAKLNASGNCILCGACYGACNAVEVNPNFVGPHALAKAARLVADTRDSETDQRLDQYNSATSGVWGCTRCFNCNTVCPVGVQPLDRISEIKQAILARSTTATRNQDRALRHRQVLLALVKEGGWVDERQFGLRVVGNRFRDLGGVVSLAPLGWRLLRRGKFPLRFEKSAGQAQIKAVITALQQKQPASKI
ncbi:succinate dehydrogenase/fumarate reductase iron-sulfur subunit [Thermosynechococcus sp. HN-54]|uniref:succinate dehydrogenase/fumarate reductase iron-sulfur subunit n=1 Tax=Thermosynechococcus sp. HN-54 TaxID=2933959 RepID=UPI00202CA74B|nr:succinate dehydrogenase/fumarate reductase iron-sulfur subunit [Thermosynechococcus sp. HN-54]URR36445.1 succinate dehydrogenase/fumarate reductase iron-sulfur subunit [Thermosynechococcus sp. HN-54]